MNLDFYNINIKFLEKDYNVELLEIAFGVKSKLLRDKQTRIFTQIDIDPSQLGEMSAQEYAEQILSNYSILVLQQKIELIVENAMVFGRDVMKRYGAKNILANKSDDDIDNILIDLNGIINALVSGSLKSAKRQAESFIPTESVSQDDINWFINELDSYLSN